MCCPMERRLRQHGYMDAALVSNLAVEPIARASYVIMFALSEASIKPL